MHKSPTTSTDPVIIDQVIRDHDWTVTLTLGDNLPQQLAATILGADPGTRARIIAALAGESTAGTGARLLADLIAGHTFHLPPDEAEGLGDDLVAAATYPGKCHEEDCTRILFNAGMCKAHYMALQDDIDAEVREAIADTTAATAQAFRPQSPVTLHLTRGAR